MSRFRITGKERGTGQRVELTLEAGSEMEARQSPLLAGVEIESVGPALAATATDVATEVWSQAKRLIREPVDNAEAYRGIPRNATAVRTGATIIKLFAYVVLVVGLLWSAYSVIILIGASNSFDRRAAFWSLVSAFLTILWAILIASVAAYFKMISYTCEALRDLVIRSSQRT
jgi:hypothetical protein